MSEKKPTVLVVDDESDMRDLHKVLLMHVGFNVLEAADGIQALMMINEEELQIDAILSDVIMP